jgi:hypothetical protein
MNNTIRSNFDMLRAYEEQLWRLGALAERYFAEDPNTSLLKLRQFSELLAQSLAARNCANAECHLHKIQVTQSNVEHLPRTHAPHPFHPRLRRPDH